MSYLKFDKKLMINLQESLPKEMLRTNKSGAYHCTSIVNCNTRKQHGLLVLPIPELDKENHVLLSSLDESVIQHGAAFNLGIHKYQGDCYSPNGHKYIREFDCESVPKTTYRVGGVVLTKEKVFISHENRILIKYTLQEAHSATTLQFRPFLAFRDVNSLTQENDVINKSYEVQDNGISCRLYDGYPDLYMQFNKAVEFVYNPMWNKGIEYLKELERGQAYKEDLYVPGYFEVSIKKGESVIFSAGVSPIKPRSLTALYNKEMNVRTMRTSFFNCLKNSAEQFYLKQDDKQYLLAGYPWFKVRARDLFVSLPGCTLSLDNEADFHVIMETAKKALHCYMNNASCDNMIEEMDVPDTLLWCVWAIQQYAKESSPKECWTRYGEFLIEIIDFIRKGKHPNLSLHDNGLLYSNGREKPISWMNSTAYGRPVVARTGYLVEFNALWYNALRFVASIICDEKYEGKADTLNTLSERAAFSFREVFINGYGYLYDFVDGSYADWSVRPNMLLAASLDYSPLDKKQRKSVLDIVTRELLTPNGIRSLSPKSTGYNPNCIGTQLERHYAYHQGAVWPWLMGAYTDAYLRIFGRSGAHFIGRMMIGYEDEITNHCIGSISELFDGNPPFKARGAISYAMNVAEILRAYKMLAKYQQ